MVELSSSLHQLRSKVSMLLEMKYVTKEGAPWRPRRDGLGVRAMTLFNWRSGKAAEIKSLQDVCDAFNDLGNVPGTLSIGMFCDDVTDDEFAKTIGFSTSKIKEQYYTNRFGMSGPQTEFFFDTKRKGGKKILDDHFRAVEGCYHGYRVQGRAVVRFGLVVPFAVPITQRVDEGQFVIIADISIPNAGGGEPYLYSGMVSTRQDLTTWLFVQTGQQWRDMVYLTTDQGDAGRADRQRHGKMQTRAQSGATASPVNYDIAIRRQGSAEGKSLLEIEEFLAAAATMKPKLVDRDLRKFLLPQT